jgi:hypothetical protein
VALLGAALAVAAWLGHVRAEDKPQEKEPVAPPPIVQPDANPPVNQETPPVPVKKEPTAPTTPPTPPLEPRERLYPTIKFLDFALDRRLAGQLRDDYYCPQPINVAGLTLTKPEELPIDLPTVLKLAGCDNLDYRAACVKLREARAVTLQAKLEFLPTLTPIFDNPEISFGARTERGRSSLMWKRAAAWTRHRHGLADRRDGVQSPAAAPPCAGAAGSRQVSADDARYNAVSAFYDPVFTHRSCHRSGSLEAGGRDTQTARKPGKGGGALWKEARSVARGIEQVVALAQEKMRLNSLALTDLCTSIAGDADSRAGSQDLIVPFRRRRNFTCWWRMDSHAAGIKESRAY